MVGNKNVLKDGTRNWWWVSLLNCCEGTHHLVLNPPFFSHLKYSMEKNKRRP
jgi:hypothetical protein